MIRKPAVAGMFYPESKFDLSDSIDKLFDSTKSDSIIQNVRGIISPHAGYAYSGKTAAYAFNQIVNKSFDNVVVIAPSHREYFDGNSIYNGDAYETPLGLIPLNTEMRDELAERSEKIFTGLNGHRSEHSIEVILPFLQSAIGDFSLVPIVIGAQSPENINALADALSSTINEGTLLVASTDLSHFYPRSIADKLDGVFEADVDEFEHEKLQKDLDEGNCEACGGGPTIVLMKTTEMLSRVKSTVLNRTDSGETTGDLNEVVGYLSAVISA